MLTRNIIITDADRRRLGTLLERAAADVAVDRRYLDALEHELDRAEVVGPREIPRDVITMNSTVRLRDLDAEDGEAGDTETFTLVYPRDANIEENRISVLAPIGTAMLGYQTGDTIEWPVPGGVARFRVEEIVYQPEGAGAWER